MEEFTLKYKICLDMIIFKYVRKCYLQGILQNGQNVHFSSRTEYCCKNGIFSFLSFLVLITPRQKTLFGAAQKLGKRFVRANVDFCLWNVIHFEGLTANRNRKAGYAWHTVFQEMYFFQETHVFFKVSHFFFWLTHFRHIRKKMFSQKTVTTPLQKSALIWQLEWFISNIPSKMNTLPDSTEIREVRYPWVTLIHIN